MIHGKAVSGRDESVGEVAPLGKNNPMHHCMLVADWPESSSRAKDLGVLVNTELSMSQQCAHLLQKEGQQPPGLP